MPPNSDPKYYKKLAKISAVVKEHAITNVLAGSVSLSVSRNRHEC
jgi:hypothetical protein